MLKPRHMWPLVIAATLTCGACVSNPNAPAGANPAGPSAVDSSPAVAPAAEMPLPTGGEPVNLNPADFSADITHAFWPMKPGTRWVYRGLAEGEPPQDVVVVATTATKKLANGITARAVRDTARSEGQLIEDTIDYYAQDKAGNLWYMGEETAEYENGKVVSRAGSWEAGKAGAMPGILLPALPQDGQKYRQEYKKGEAEDNGEVIATDTLVQVKTGRYKNSLVTMDTSNVEKTAVEYKFYAPAVGPLLALDVSGGSTREELVKIEQAGPSAGTGPIGNPNP